MRQPSDAQPRLRDRLREEAGRAILAAAEQVFAEDGLGARMERIAAQAGVAVGTLYNHFQDRDALLAALTCSRCDALMARVDAALAATAGGPVAERLSAFLGAVAEHARVHGRFLSMLVQAGEGPARAKAHTPLRSELVRRVEDVLRAAHEAGEVRADEAGLFAPAFVAMVRAALLQRLEEGTDLDEAAPALVRLLLEGVRS